VLTISLLSVFQAKIMKFAL